MKFLNQHKSEIFVGIIVFFITSILSLIIAWFNSSAPMIGETLWDYTMNVLYTASAQQSDSTFVRNILSNFLWTAVIYILIWSIKAFRIIGRANKTLQQIAHIENTKSQKVDLDANNKVAKSKNDLKLESVKLKMATALLIILTFLLLFLVYFAYITPNQIWAKFEQDITMIKPYVDNSKIDELRSNWVCMRSENDYTEIYAVINDVKQTNNLPN